MRGLVAIAALVGAGLLAGTAWAPPREADLAVLVRPSRAGAAAGQAVRFATLVRNIGPDSALEVVVRQTLPPGVVLLSAAPSQGTCSGASTVTCRLGLMGWGNLAHDARATIELVVRADVPGTIETTAEVSSSSLALELVPENNASTARVDVTPYTGERPRSELGVELLAPKTAKVGRRFSYLARITNYGPDPTGALAVGAEERIRLSTVARRRGPLTLAYRGATAKVLVR